VLDAGRPIAAGTSAQVLTDERVVSAYLGAVGEPGATDRTEPRPTEPGAVRPGAHAQRPVEAAGEARG
jgi:hypothetical protein